MKVYTIPVSWEVSDTIEVRANSLKEAIKYAEEHKDEIPISSSPEYIGDSYKIDGDLANEDEAYDDGRNKVEIVCY